MGVEISFSEDCVESGVPDCQINEDEEKFFDRICLEIILAALRVSGFPKQGWVELKASCMSSKIVEINTNKGMVYATFECGLEQGNLESSKISNLVIAFKNDMWERLLIDNLGNIKKGEKHAYNFFARNVKDGKIKLFRIG